VKQLEWIRTSGAASFFGLAHHQRDRLFHLVFHFVDDHPEAAEPRRQIGLGAARHQFLVQSPVGDQLFDRDQLQAMAGGQFEQCFARRPIALLIQDFAQDAGRSEPRHASQVDRRLGVPRTAQDASLLGQQRMHMPRPQELAGLGAGIDHL
jgi:hypothetical protein